MQRNEAYRIVQDAAQRAWDERIGLRELLADRPELGLGLELTMYSALWEPASDAVNRVRRAAPQGSTHGRVWDPA